ncbi:MAG: hypothetical protein HY303_20145 [Candidatus Wallbacteria bacterium]|nr:hypothetical protein [Candidatus Wallbacteria bacterium]
MVDKVARQVRAEARQLLDSNMRSAQRIATKPQVRMQLINALAEAGIQAVRRGGPAALSCPGAPGFILTREVFGCILRGGAGPGRPSAPFCPPT